MHKRTSTTYDAQIQPSSGVGQSRWRGRKPIVVDTEFDEKNATEGEILYDEIMPPIIEKEKTLEANEHSVYQLLDLIKKTCLDGMSKTYQCTKKSHANMF